MKANVAVGGIAVSLLLAAGPAQAQVVQAGVVIRGGPVAGHVVIARPPVYREPRHVVVVNRYPARAVVIERLYVPRGAYGWWRGYGYRPVVVYYDGRRYYHRWFPGPTLRRIEVYERGGHFYRWDG